MFNDICLPHLVPTAKMANVFQSTYIENRDAIPVLYTSWYKLFSWNKVYTIPNKRWICEEVFIPS